MEQRLRRGRMRSVTAALRLRLGNKNFDRAKADIGHIYRTERVKPGWVFWPPELVGGLLAEAAGITQR